MAKKTPTQPRIATRVVDGGNMVSPMVNNILKRVGLSKCTEKFAYMINGDTFHGRQGSEAGRQEPRFEHGQYQFM